MSKKYLQGEFSPVHADKYVGTYPIVYRSSWELTVCRMCDNHPNIVQWASESMKIPYRNPITGKYTVYIPDFLVVFEDRKGNIRKEVWEIKPKQQTFMEHAKRPREKLALAINAMKWKAAQIFCKENGMVFRVITEDEIFRNNKR